MEAADVVGIYPQLERASIAVWIGGGRGVDAPLGRQTRPHKDLDPAVQERDLPRRRDLLAARGYREIERGAARPHSVVLGDAAGHGIDVHVVVLGAEGTGISGPPGDGETYPAASPTGTGAIAAAAVRSVSPEWPEWTDRFHNGCEPRDEDFRDASALCDRFGPALPEDHRRFAANRAERGRCAVPETPKPHERADTPRARARSGAPAVRPANRGEAP